MDPTTPHPKSSTNNTKSANRHSKPHHFQGQAHNSTATRSPLISEADDLIGPFLSNEEILDAAFTFSAAQARSGQANIPEVEDLGPYGIKPTIQKRLWRLEIERLTAAVQYGDEIVSFDEDGLFNTLTNVEGFSALHYVSKEILVGFFLCIHDFGLHVLEHSPDPLASVIKATIKSHQILVTRERWLNDADRNEEPPDCLKGKENDAYYELVDYLTATLAKFLARCALGRTWTQECLALLAKWSTKLKIVARDPRGNYRISINKARRLREQKQLEIQEDIVSEGFATVYVDNSDSKKRSELVAALDDAMKAGKGDRGVALRSLKAQMFYEYLTTCFTCLLNDLQTGQMGPECFQLARVVYKSGIDDWRILLSSDRDSVITASSSLACLRFAHAGLKIFTVTAAHIKSQHTVPDPQTLLKANGHEVDVGWNFESAVACLPPKASQGVTGSALQRSTKTIGQLKLSTIGDVVRLMIPLSLLDAYLLAQVSSLIDIVSMIEDWKPPEAFENVKFTAVTHMTTAEHNTRFAEDLDKDVRRIPTIPFGSATVGQRSGTSEWKGNTLASGKPAPSHEDYFYESAEELHAAERQMREWTYDENSIAIPCKLYVTSVVAAAILLVGGGLGVGFSVHTRITGVDPFNITLFFWILAGFILAVAQSMRVENWPWRDFISRRVVCRSVSEVHAVTGISEQLILRKLLEEEDGNILQTRGPFNEPFERKSNSSDGFSIDRPLTLKTMMLSGLVMIKVKTPDGFALVCLNARRETILDGVKFHEFGQDSDQKRLVCLNISDSAKGRYGQFKLTRRTLGWVKTVGMYSVMDSKFG